jgi:hypothetical protein
MRGALMFLKKSENFCFSSRRARGGAEGCGRLVSQAIRRGRIAPFILASFHQKLKNSIMETA